MNDDPDLTMCEHNHSGPILGTDDEQQRAVLGDVEAQFRLGERYRTGTGVGCDAVQAFKWYRMAAENGHSGAQNSLGTCLIKGVGCERDVVLGTEFLRKAATNGLPLAMNNLGAAYRKGQGVPQNHEQAVMWFSRAAYMGLAIAQNNLASCFEHGDGIRTDAATAAAWYRKAAEQGYALAQRNLGSCYRDGFGVPRDAEQSAHWYRLAAAQGNEYAQYHLGMLYLAGSGVERDATQAVAWFRKAAAQGLARAQFQLGVCHLRGEGVRIDVDEASRWMQHAAASGSLEAQNHIAPAKPSTGKTTRRQIRPGTSSLHLETEPTPSRGHGQSPLVTPWVNEPPIIREMPPLSLPVLSAETVEISGDPAPSELSAETSTAGITPVAIDTQVSVGVGEPPRGVEVPAAVSAVNKVPAPSEVPMPPQLVLSDPAAVVPTSALPLVAGDLAPGAEKPLQASDQASRSIVSNSDHAPDYEASELLGESAPALTREGVEAVTSLPLPSAAGAVVDPVPLQSPTKSDSPSHAGRTSTPLPKTPAYAKDRRATEVVELFTESLVTPPPTGMSAAPATAAFRASYPESSAVVSPAAVKLHQQGLAWLKGDGVAVNKAQAVTCFTNSAKLNYSPAMFSLGQCYEKGEGVLQDKQLALSWYRHAADAGYAPAQYQLGAHLTYGWGIKRDLLAALQWYLLSAAQGLAQAQYQIGECYAKGWGVKPDFNQAKNWWQKAAEQGHQEAHESLKRFRS